jgi:hypothetical protein
MIKPTIVAPGEEVTEVGRVFDAPLVVKGNTWLPIVQILVWGAMSNLAGNRKPGRTWPESLVMGALTMPVVVGLEWLHNLSHAAAAQLTGHPVDAIRITWGMPLLVYFEINDQTVTPEEHIIRAVGGPLFNIIMLPLWQLVYRLSPSDSIGREVGEAGLWMNRFLLIMGMLPIPGLDGGPILKWSLVAGGKTIYEADEVVRKVNGPLSVGLGAVSVVAFKKRRRMVGVLSAIMAVTAALIFSRKLQET